MAAPPDRRRLDTWGQIAAYLDRDVTTVMRWERERGLPVHRVPGGQRHAVFAYQDEIDAWMLNGQAAGPLTHPSGSPSPASGRGQDVETRTADTSAIVPATRRWRLGYVLGLLALGIIAAVAYYLARPLPTPHVRGYTQLTNDGREKFGNLVTDGARLYFVERLPIGQAIVQVSTPGGEAQTLSTFFKSPYIEDLSLRRGEILVVDPIDTAGQPPALWVMPLAGGEPRPVGNIFANSAAWSPDGNTIAYSEGPNLYVSRSDGTGSRKIASLESIVKYIRWSPDGRRLRMTVCPPGKGVYGIWEAQTDGSQLHALVADWGSSESSAGGLWTPDGRYFLFTQGSGFTGDLWAVFEASGTWGLRRGVPVQLPLGPFRVANYAISLDGKTVFLFGYGSRVEMLRYSSASNGFEPFLAGFQANYADFSRDGRWLAYADGASAGNLWRRRADGTQPLQLTFPPMVVELPRWSPDGKQIAFMGQKTPQDPWQVYLIPAEGGECQPVLPAAYPQGAPTWSPDGAQLAFGELTMGGERADPKMSIHVVDLRTHKATTIPGSTGLFTARWSPDGRHLAALSSDSHSLTVFDFRRQRWEKLATAGNITDLNWTRASEWVYFEDRRPPQGPAIFRVRLRDRRMERVATLDGEPPISSRWLGLAPDDSLLVSNDTEWSEIYALDWETP